MLFYTSEHEKKLHMIKTIDDLFLIVYNNLRYCLFSACIENCKMKSRDISICFDNFFLQIFIKALYFIKCWCFRLENTTYKCSENIKIFYKFQESYNQKKLIYGTVPK